VYGHCKLSCWQCMDTILSCWQCHLVCHKEINDYINKCRSQWPRGLQPLVCWDSGFESRRGHGCLSVVIVVRCQVEVSATVRSLVQRSPTECCVSECDIETSTVGRCRPTRAVEPWERNARQITYPDICVFVSCDLRSQMCAYCVQRPYLTEVNFAMNIADFTLKAVIMVKRKRNLRFRWLCVQFGHPS